MSKGSSGNKGGGKGSGKGGNPNWPSKTSNPSGGDRGNNPPPKKQERCKLNTCSYVTECLKHLILDHTIGLYIFAAYAWKGRHADV